MFVICHYITFMSLGTMTHEVKTSGAVAKYIFLTLRVYRTSVAPAPDVRTANPSVLLTSRADVSNRMLYIHSFMKIG
jgi:hypothetical protein